MKFINFIYISSFLFFLFSCCFQNANGTLESTYVNISSAGYDIQSQTLTLVSDFHLLTRSDATYALVFNNGKIPVSLTSSTYQLVNSNTTRQVLDFDYILSGQPNPHFPTNVAGVFTSASLQQNVYLNLFSTPSFYFKSSTAFINSELGGIFSFYNGNVSSADQYNVYANGKNINSDCSKSGVGDSVNCNIKVNDESLIGAPVLMELKTLDNRFTFTTTFTYANLQIKSVKQQDMMALVDVGLKLNSNDLKVLNNNNTVNIPFTYNSTSGILSFFFTVSSTSDYTIVYKSSKYNLSRNWRPVLFPKAGYSQDGENEFQVLFGGKITGAYFDSKSVVVSEKILSSSSSVVTLVFPKTTGTHKVYVQINVDIASNEIVIQFPPPQVTTYSCTKYLNSANITVSKCTINGKWFPNTEYMIYKNNSLLPLLDPIGQFNNLTFSSFEGLAPKTSYTILFQDLESSNFTFLFDPITQVFEKNFTIQGVDGNYTIIEGIWMNSILKVELNDKIVDGNLGIEVQCEYFTESYKEFINCTLPQDSFDKYLFIYPSSHLATTNDTIVLTSPSKDPLGSFSCLKKPSIILISSLLLSLFLIF